MREVAEGVQGTVATDIHVEVEVREGTGIELEMRVCKISESGLFENDAMALYVWHMYAQEGSPFLVGGKSKSIENSSKRGAML